MAFDGITIRALTNELNTCLTGCRIVKIAQTEKDELMLTIKGNSSQYRLLISANASLPLIYLTSANKPAPLTAPNFCMLLRKHIGNGRILSVTQHGLERIVDIETESRDEMGDLVKRHLMVELMGKHSNIIMLGDNNTIIDSIKRVNASVSSVREVLPGREYFIPNTEGKINLLEQAAQISTTEQAAQISAAGPSDTTLPSREMIADKLLSMNYDICKAIYGAYSGISPQAAMYVCKAAQVDPNANVRELTNGELLQISSRFTELLEDIKAAKVDGVSQEYPSPTEIGSHADIELRRERDRLAIRAGSTETVVVVGGDGLQHQRPVVVLGFDVVGILVAETIDKTLQPPLLLRLVHTQRVTS